MKSRAFLDSYVYKKKFLACPQIDFGALTDPQLDFIQWVFSSIVVDSYSYALFQFVC